MPRDEFNRLPNDTRHPVVIALDRWMEGEQLEQSVLARTAKVSYQRLNKMLSRGRIAAKPQLDILLDVEQAYGLPCGYFLRRGGLVTDPQTPQEMIQADGRINERYRRTLLDIYEAALRAGPDEDKESSRGL